MTQHQKNPRSVFVALAAGVLSTLAALPVTAIDLGAASLKSATNAPLEIDIALLDIAPGELESLKPQLPANSRSAELASASIELVQLEGVAPVLRLRTPQPVSADEVRFVVVADWGRGRKFREYVVSLVSASPPVTTDAAPEAAPAIATSVPPPAAATVEAAAPSSAETTFTTRADGGAVTQTRTAESVAGETSAPAAGLKTTRIVRNGETLMSISREWSATTGATLAQTMLGIFQANPQAFGPRGMNELLVGSEIVLPEPAMLLSTSRAAASSEIGRTLGIWRTTGTPATSSGAGTAVARENSSPPAVAPAPPAALPPVTAPPPAAVQPPAPLSLAPVSPPSTASVPSAAAPAAEAPPVPETPEATIARLQGELLDKTEQLAAKDTEAAALQARLDAAERAAAVVAATQRPAGGWLGEVRRWAALAWWTIPLLFLMSLGLLLALLRARRAAAGDASATASVGDSITLEQTGSAPSASIGGPAAARTEMTFDLPPIKASRASEGMPDVLLGEAPRPRTVPAAPPATIAPAASAAAPVVDESLTEDLEGDPPPVDEAGSKINLARAFIEMGHHDAAILELQAALRLGDETQRAEALRLLDSLPKS
jgi:FimV-like protein